MFSCLGIRRQLSAYLDGELSLKRRTAVERHLVRCRSCHAALESLRRLERSLQVIEVPPVGPDLTWRIMTEARKRRDAHGEPSVISLHRGSSASRTWVFRGAAAAMLVFGLAVGSYMGWSAKRSTSQVMTAQTDRLDAYKLDYLGDAPDGSLASSYLALASHPEGF